MAIRLDCTWGRELLGREPGRLDSGVRMEMGSGAAMWTEVVVAWVGIEVWDGVDGAMGGEMDGGVLGVAEEVGMRLMVREDMCQDSWR
jgi:hypothetical protein